MYLLVGDIHAQTSNLAEVARLLDFIDEQASLYKVKSIIFLGDLFHNHSIVNTEVLTLYTEYFKKARNSEILIVIGNHDMSHDSKTHALVSFHDYDNLTIIDDIDYIDSMGFIPFRRKKEDFISNCLELHKNNVKVIFCHQDILGAKYENGVDVPDGVDLSLLPDDLNFYSGHIHKAQILNRVNYIGSARQITIKDESEKKHLALFDGKEITKNIIIPESVCEIFKSIYITENSNNLDISNVSNKTIVHLIGSPEFIKNMKKTLPVCKIKDYPTHINDQIFIKESDGIPVAFKKYFDNYCLLNNVSEAEKCGIIKLITDKTKMLVE